MTERIDEIERYYKPIEFLDSWNSWLFWLSAALSIMVLYESHIPWQQLEDLPSVLFVALVIVHLALSFYIRYYLFPIAERMRRRQLLSDSFSVHLIPEKTQKYYNNDLAPSIARLGANILENALFAKTISLDMANRERVKILLYFVIWIFAALWRSTNIGLLVIITQTLFSSEVLENWLRIELLCRENENFYDELYHKFLHNVDFDSPSGIASVLDTFASYETAKGTAGLKLSSKIFSSINPTVSTQWETIKKQLGM